MMCGVSLGAERADCGDNEKPLGSWTQAGLSRWEVRVGCSGMSASLATRNVNTLVTNRVESSYRRA
jgi:hypothetical protein